MINFINDVEFGWRQQYSSDDGDSHRVDGNLNNNICSCSFAISKPNVLYKIINKHTHFMKSTPGDKNDTNVSA